MRPSRSTRSVAQPRISIIRTLIAFLISLAFILPFLFLIATALRTPEDFSLNPGGMPASFTQQNLTDAWHDANLGRALLVTLAVAAIACVVCVGVSLAAAFWFRVNDSRFASACRMLMISGYAIPAIAWLIPVFVIVARGGLAGNVAVAGVLNGVSSTPFAIYFFYTYFLQVLSNDLLDAAALDGADTLACFRRIALPLARPAIASVVALVFVWSFGDLLIAVTILQSNPDNYTLPLAATTLATKESVNLQGQAAAALVALVPVLVVFALAQRSLQKGFGALSEK